MELISLTWIEDGQTQYLKIEKWHFYELKLFCEIYYIGHGKSRIPCLFQNEIILSDKMRTKNVIMEKRFLEQKFG
jgi:hypothetical protein